MSYDLLLTGGMIYNGAGTTGRAISIASWGKERGMRAMEIVPWQAQRRAFLVRSFRCGESLQYHSTKGG